MSVSKAPVILLIAFLGTSWFTGDGFVSASPLPQGYPVMNQNPNGYMGGPGYYVAPQPNYLPQPQVLYVQPPNPGPQRPPLIKTWDGIHDWAQNVVQSTLGQQPLNG